MNRGLISKMFDWTTHPLYSDGTPADWIGGFVLVMCAAFLWSRVLREITTA